MALSDKLEAFYGKDRPFREEIGLLRELALQTRAEESYKWSAPVYTLGGKNIFGIMAFKNHFGIWFFNGVFLKDPAGVLASAQEKTRGMRHWKFSSADEIDAKMILAYMNEALDNQEKGLDLKPEKKKTEIPPELQKALKDPELKKQFQSLAPYKQREYCEHIGSAKQEKTRLTRLEKSIPMILKGIALHDKYR